MHEFKAVTRAVFPVAGLVEKPVVGGEIQLVDDIDVLARHCLVGGLIVAARQAMLRQLRGRGLTMKVMGSKPGRSTVCAVMNEMPVAFSACMASPTLLKKGN